VATTRIILKNGVEEDWNKVVNFIPYKGEMIVYNPDETHPYTRVKVGNGTNLPRDLPFIDAGSVSGMNLDNIVAAKVKHKLTFGAGQTYQYDGSADVTVPVYQGAYTLNNAPDVGYQEDNFDDD